MKKNKINIFKKTGMILLSSLFLVGCESLNLQTDEVSSYSSNGSSIVENESQEPSKSDVDHRFVPEFSQVIADFKEREDIELSDKPIFELSESFTQTQNSFQFNVDKMQVYEVENIDETLKSEFNFKDEAGAILLLEVSITNLTDETIYYPIEGLRLSYESANVQMHPSIDLYPSQTGELVNIFEQNNHEIGPSMTVNGYIIYGLSSQDWEEVSEAGNVYLTVVAPQTDPDAITGIGASELGDERALYLPVNESVEGDLLYNNNTIGDRLSTEWWGNKEILASDNVNVTDTDEDVTVELLRVELSNFEPHSTYEANFQNFNYGQVIMSIEYEITNNSENELLPVDGQASLQIGEDPIHSDYVLINDFNGTILEPGESYKTVKSFALDKLRYYEVWQGEPIYIAVNIPVREENSQPTEDSNSEEIVVSEALLYFFEFSWTPKLDRFINESLEVVEEDPSELMSEEDDSLDENELVSEEESESEDAGEKITNN
ncbi:hypothetical protein ACF3NG_07380 [Aerococcaceae bacterium WGS1372]